MAFIFKFFKKKEPKPDHCVVCCAACCMDEPIQQEVTSWVFDTKKQAFGKLFDLKNKDTYEIVQNRANGKIAKGWILRKRK